MRVIKKFNNAKKTNKTQLCVYQNFKACSQETITSSSSTKSLSLSKKTINKWKELLEVVSVNEVERTFDVTS